MGTPPKIQPILKSFNSFIMLTTSWLLATAWTGSDFQRCVKCKKNWFAICPQLPVQLARLYKTGWTALSVNVVALIGYRNQGVALFCRFTHLLVVVVLRSPIHANEPSEYNGMLYRSSNRVLNNGIKVIILICMDGTSQYHHYPFARLKNIALCIVPSQSGSGP